MYPVLGTFKENAPHKENVSHVAHVVHLSPKAGKTREMLIMLVCGLAQPPLFTHDKNQTTKTWAHPAIHTYGCNFTGWVVFSLKNREIPRFIVKTTLPKPSPNQCFFFSSFSSLLFSALVLVFSLCLFTSSSLKATHPVRLPAHTVVAEMITELVRFEPKICICNGY